MKSAHEVCIDPLYTHALPCSMRLCGARLPDGVKPQHSTQDFPQGP